MAGTWRVQLDTSTSSKAGENKNEGGVTAKQWIEERFVQPEKACMLMLLTLLGIVTLVRLEQSLKTDKSIIEILFGISIFVKPKQYPKASYPMYVTLLGMVILVNPEHPLKADGSMRLTLSPIVIFVRPEQLAKA